MKRGWTLNALFAVVGVGLLSVGCRSTAPVADPAVFDCITHAGTYANLSRGDYAGSFPVTNLVRYGDHGLGTFDRLDGELVMVGGVVYRADVDCRLGPPGVSNLTPFAVITPFAPDRMFDVENMTDARFRRALDLRGRPRGIPQAIQVEGRFKQVTIRSVPAQAEPWRPLDEAIAADARSLTVSNVNGVLVGYYYPDNLTSLHPAGYHLHMVDAERTFGGHVLGFEIDKARISIDNSPYLNVILPEGEIEKPASPSVRF